LLHHGDVPLYENIADQGRMLGLPWEFEAVPLDGVLTDGDVLTAGAITLRTIHTPGHTPGSSTFAVEHDGATTLYTGDTLFRGGVGRWDLGGTSLEDIVDSIRTKLFIYPDDAVVVAGHGPASTIGIERATNPFLLSPRA
jgi:glyoxylase-like metal-dependent hydrolase (beta-lactamase superfamily II)